MRNSRLLSCIFVIALASAQPQSALGRCALEIDRGEFESASRDARAFLKQHPDSVNGHVLLARSLIGLNDAAGALQQLQQALRLAPDSQDALYYVTKLAAVLSQQQFADVARLAPESARMHQIKAELLQAQGDSDAAEREYLDALKQRPDTPYIMNALGDLKRQDKQYAAAFEWYEKTLASDPDNYDALYGAGVCQRAEHSMQKAVPLFRRALHVDPASTSAQMALGEALLDTGDPKEAVGLLESSAKLDPRLRRLQYLLYRAYKTLGRTDDARRALARVRELTNGDDSDDEADK